jgi:hypothetical protein
MVLGSYRDPRRGVDIPNARIIECTDHGVQPADDAESQRWLRIRYLETTGAGPHQDQCDKCGKPRGLTGQFWYFGWGPEYTKLCNECLESGVKPDDVTPVRGDVQDGFGI